MTSRQTAAICITILLAASANLLGGFAIQLHFENRRSEESAARHEVPGEPRLGNVAGVPGSAPLLQEVAGDPNLVPLPSPFEEEEDFTAVIGDGVGQPPAVRDGRRYSPRELPDAEDAAPLRPRPLVADGVMASIIASELPQATSAEREVWMKQLQGLSPNEARVLLQMRRRFGSEIRPSIEPLPPLFAPGELPGDANEGPIVAPVPEIER